MTTPMRARYETARDRIRADDEISETDTRRILAFLDANDPRRETPGPPDGGTKKDGTLRRYARGVGRVARDLETDLTEATTEDINGLMEAYANGDAEGVKAGGLSNSSVQNFQGPIRQFYRYHGDLKVRPEDLDEYTWRVL